MNEFHFSSLQKTKKNKIFQKLRSFLKENFSKKRKKDSTPKRSRQDVFIEETERVGMMSCLTMNLD